MKRMMLPGTALFERMPSANHQLIPTAKVVYYWLIPLLQRHQQLIVPHTCTISLLTFCSLSHHQQCSGKSNFGAPACLNLYLAAAAAWQCLVLRNP